jgi:regulator of replication initiation timing
MSKTKIVLIEENRILKMNNNKLNKELEKLKDYIRGYKDAVYYLGRKT